MELLLRKTKIYKLVDPRDGRARYVGKTIVSLRQRLNSHISRSKENKTPSQKWIYELKKIGLVPKINLIEKVEAGESWEDKEKFWIKNFRELYGDLLNLCIGGKSSSGHKMSNKAKKEIAKRSRDKKLHVFANKAWEETYILGLPEGPEIEVTNLHNWCKDRGLDSSRMVSMARRSKSHHQFYGYTCRYKDDQKNEMFPYLPNESVARSTKASSQRYVATKNGVTHHLLGLPRFCAKVGLDTSHAYKMSKAGKKYRGWLFQKADRESLELMLSMKALKSKNIVTFNTVSFSDLVSSLVELGFFVRCYENIMEFDRADNFDLYRFKSSEKIKFYSSDTTWYCLCGN